MRRILVGSDPHGYLLPLKLALEAARYEPVTDLLVLEGDYVDGGPDTPQILEFIRKLQEQGAIILKGNHEEMFAVPLSSAPPKLHKLFLANDPTFGAYLRFGDAWKEVVERDVNFVRSLPTSFDFGPYFFVHAGINPRYSLHQQSEETLLWIRYLEDNRGWWEVPVLYFTI